MYIRARHIAGVGLLIAFPLHAQDLEQIGSSKPLALSGSLTTSLITRVSDTGAAGVSWIISANPSLSVYSFEFPFSLTMSDQSRGFTQPFNEYGMSPRYRWITLHGGYRNLSYSSFTLAGHQFLGGGFDLTPGPIRVSGMYGRLLRAVAFDSTQTSTSVAAYERWGYAAKVGIGKPTNYVDVIYLSARDAEGSLEAPPWVSGITPAQNVITGIVIHQQILKVFTWNLEGAASGYTRDLDAAEVDDGGQVPSFLKRIITVNSSSRISTALKTSFKWSHKTAGLELAYRRVDPGYQSMGAYYLQSDIEEVTVGPSVRLWQSKLSLAGKIGVARDDLLRTKQNQTLRLVGSATASVRPSPLWGVDLSYSNNSNSRQTRIDSLADSLNMLTLVNTIGVIPSFNFGNDTWRSTVSPAAFVQFFGTSSTPSASTPDMVSQSYSLGYTLSHVPSSFSLSPGLLTTLMRMGNIHTETYGGSITASKPFFSQKLSTSLTTGVTTHFQNAEYRALSIPSGLDVAYTLAERHRFSLRSFFTGTMGTLTGIGTPRQQGRSDLSLEVSYAYTF